MCSEEHSGEMRVKDVERNGCGLNSALEISPSVVKNTNGEKPKLCEETMRLAFLWEAYRPEFWYILLSRQNC